MTQILTKPTTTSTTTNNNNNNNIVQIYRPIKHSTITFYENSLLNKICEVFLSFCVRERKKKRFCFECQRSERSIERIME